MVSNNYKLLEIYPRNLYLKLIAKLPVTTRYLGKIETSFMLATK